MKRGSCQALRRPQSILVASGRADTVGQHPERRSSCFPGASASTVIGDRRAANSPRTASRRSGSRNRDLVVCRDLVAAPAAGATELAPDPRWLPVGVAVAGELPGLAHRASL